MKVSQTIDSERELFFNDMTERLGDKVYETEMVCIEASNSTWDFMQMSPLGNQKELWGLLLFCEKSLHFYVHSTESPMMSMFRATSNRKPPTEQLFSFSSFTSWKAAPSIKHGIFGKKPEKFTFLVHFTCDPMDEKTLDTSKIDKPIKNEAILIVKTQIKATSILHRMQALQ